MTWNYRIIYHDTHTHPYWALHEVYYDKDGKIIMWALNDPDEVSDESIDDLIGALQMQLNDAIKYKADVLFASTMPNAENED